MLIALIGNATVNMFERYKEAKVRADRAAEELALLEERRAKLASDLARLSPPRGTEEELRRRFNVAADGEKVIVIVDPKTNAPEEGISREETTWQKIVRFFYTD